MENSQNQNLSNNPQPTQNAYTYTPPQASNIVYQKPKSKSWLKVLFTCSFIFFLIACVCLVPFILLISFAARLDSTALNQPPINQSLIYEKNLNSKEATKLAVINITGAISYSMPGSGYGTVGTSESIIAQLEKARRDKSVNAVLLRFNTPGGEVVAAEPICNKIKEVNTQKPVYSFIDSMGASLGYLLPNCSSYIYARPEAITGSIGVIIEAIDWYGVLEKLGGKVTFITNTEGDQKSGRDIFTEGSETYKTYQKILDETYEYFVDKVYEGRKENHSNISKEYIKQYADGRILSGRQALDAKFVDELGQFEQVIDSIVKKEDLDSKRVQVIEYNIPVNPFSNIFGSLNTALQSTDIKNQSKNSGVRLMMQTGLVGDNK